MKMDKTTVAGIVKAVVACLAVAGIVVTPEQQDNIVLGWLALHSVASVIQAKFTKTDE
jgi:hypothetical protein